jgi:hypothetical protein
MNHWIGFATSHHDVSSANGSSVSGTLCTRFFTMTGHNGRATVPMKNRFSAWKSHTSFARLTYSASVPALCQRVLEANRAQPWGHGALGPGMAAVMQTIADKLGHWANLDDQGKGYVPFDPFPTPQEHLDDLDGWKRKQNEDPNQKVDPIN